VRANALPALGCSETDPVAPGTALQVIFGVRPATVSSNNHGAAVAANAIAKTVSIVAIMMISRALRDAVLENVRGKGLTHINNYLRSTV